MEEEAASYLRRRALVNVRQRMDFERVNPMLKGSLPKLPSLNYNQFEIPDETPQDRCDPFNELQRVEFFDRARTNEQSKR